MRMIKERDDKGSEFAEKIALRSICSEKRFVFSIKYLIGNGGSS